MAAKKKEKINLNEYWDANPAIKNKLNELSIKYIKEVHEFMKENTEVQAIVKISFELTK